MDQAAADKVKQIREYLSKMTPGPYRVVYNGASLLAIATDYPNPTDNRNIAMHPLIPDDSSHLLSISRARIGYV